MQQTIVRFVTVTLVAGLVTLFSAPVFACGGGKCSQSCGQKSETTAETDLEQLEAQKGQKVAQFEISGMKCTKCAAHLEAKLQQMDGVVAADVSFAKKRAKVVYSTSAADAKTIAEFVAKAGHQPGQFEATPVKGS